MKIIKTHNYKLAYTNYNTHPPIQTPRHYPNVVNTFTDSTSEPIEHIKEKWQGKKKKKKKKSQDK